MIMTSKQASSRSEVLVIGGGPGGYVAAIRASQLGKKVTIIEADTLGGVCLNRGCIPSKALISAAEHLTAISDAKEIGIEVQGAKVDFGKVQQWKQGIVNQLTSGVDGLLKGNKVKVIKGRATFVNDREVVVADNGTTISVAFEHCIIATGSRPIALPGLAFEGRILSSTEALSLQAIPETLIVVGGGYIGIELSQMYAKFGTQVTILEGSGSILPGFDKEMVKPLNKVLSRMGIKVHTDAKVVRAEQNDKEAVVYVAIDGENRTLTAEYALITVGRLPNTGQMGLEATGVRIDGKGFIEVNKQCQTNVPHIFAIGDIVSGPALAHKASYEGKVAAEVIAGYSAVVDYQAIPIVVFSDPEIAQVGLTEAEAAKEGHETITGKFAYRANGRALALHAAEGSVTIVGEKKTKRVLGAQIIGKEASNLIAEIALAIEMGATIEDIAFTIHGHPSLSEMVMEAAESSLGRGIHSLKH